MRTFRFEIDTTCVIDLLSDIFGAAGVRVVERSPGRLVVDTTDAESRIEAISALRLVSAEEASFNLRIDLFRALGTTLGISPKFLFEHDGPGQVGEGGAA